MPLHEDPGGREIICGVLAPSLPPFSFLSPAITFAVISCPPHLTWRPYQPRGLSDASYQDQSPFSTVEDRPRHREDPSGNSAWRTFPFFLL